MKRAIFVIIFILVAVASIYMLVLIKRERGARGGALVRGVVTYECVGGRP